MASRRISCVVFSRKYYTTSLYVFHEPAFNFYVRNVLSSPVLRKLTTHTSIKFERNPKEKKNIIYRRQDPKMSKYVKEEIGIPNSTGYRIYFKTDSGKPISPLHDIPLFANDEKTICNMIVEIPRWTNAKMEISMTEPLNPIKQDVKKDSLRFVANCFPHKGYIWNYGAFPQTWENPNHIEPSTGCKGDNDPIDVIEIGYRVAKIGEVLNVKILGTVALIDEGETDWKIIVIDVKDPLAEKMNDIEDVETYFPGLLRATVEWFKIYKIPDGKPENQFAFNGDAKNAVFAKNIVCATHSFWNDLIEEKTESSSISLVNTTIVKSQSCIKPEDANKIVAAEPSNGDIGDIPDTVDKWHFIHLK